MTHPSGPSAALQTALIVSAHPLFREGIARLLGEQAVVVGSVASWQEVQGLGLDQAPDVIIVDHDSSDLQEKDLTPLLWPDADDLRVIYVTLSGDKMTVHERHQVAGAGEADLLRALKGERPGASARATEGTAAPQPSYTVQRSQGRMERMDKGTDKPKYTRHFINVTVVVAVVAILAVIGLLAVPKFPQASTQALVVDWLMDLHLGVIGILFALVMGVMLYSLYVFRRKPGDEGDGDHFEGNTKLEITWTVVPLLTVLIFGVIGAYTLQDVTAAQEDEMTVNVTAFSFGWQFDYPELGIEKATTLNLPVNQPVLFKLRSLDQDVIHDFYVAEFRVKQDLVPGVPTQLRVTPNVEGNYKLRCNELCGTGHTNMLAPVNVMNETDFTAWVAEQKAAVSPEALAELGAELHASQGCIACHNVSGDAGGVGPTWKGLFGSQREFTDGTTAVADEEYLRTSILASQEKILAGYPPVMPQNYADVLSDQQIDALIEYIKTLE
ncbi:MAG TPA: cytochrome c oxidase subunit II [Anaerolineae bacterium]|nr:cytochrome c oxidase subunit II [Anaerolineae bacterium]